MLRIALILACFVALLLGAFTWATSVREPRADFTFINRGEIGTLDPNRMSWLQDIRVGYALWEGLYALDPKTLTPVAGVADRVEISPDGRTYAFHLRENARWSNGDLLTPRDFVFAWRRMLEEPGDYTYLFHVIRGARQYQEDFAAKRPADFSRVAIRTPAERELRVELEHPVAYFPDLCAFPPFWPLHEASMKPFYQSATRSYAKGFTRPPNLVSNGPFKLVSWSFRDKLRMEANEFYWDKASVKSHSIDMLIAADPMWAFLKYDSGAADWMTDASGTIGSELYERHRPDMRVFPGFGTYLYKLNCLDKLSEGQANPFRDARVRRAFSLAIDRRGIVETITKLGEPIARTYIPPGVFPGYQSPAGVEFDPAEAKRLLADAGYPGGQGFPAVGILFNSEFHHGEVAQYIRRQWLDNLGVDVSLASQETKVFRQKLHAKVFAIARASWIGDYNDLSTFLDCYRSDGENNDTGWANAQYDRLLDKAAREGDQSRRLELFREAEDLLMKEQPIIPLYHYVNAYLFRDEVKGLYCHPRNMVMFKGIYVEKK